MLFSFANESWIDAIEHQLDTTEHLEGPFAVDVAPCEIQEAITALAVNCRTPEVQRAVRPCHNADVDLPSSPVRVAGNKVVGFSPNLDTDMDVVKRGAIGIAEPPARKIEPLDHHTHAFSLPRPHFRGPVIEAAHAAASLSRGIPEPRHP